MLKKNITYEDFNGDTVSEPFYFNLTKSEMIELEVEYEGGLGNTLQRIVESTDSNSLIKEFKKLILASYGVKSDDGKRFIKSDELREQFTQTAAYDALFLELAQDAGAAEKFIKGVLPKDMVPDAATETAIQVPPLAPPAPPQA